MSAKPSSHLLGVRFGPLAISVRKVLTLLDTVLAKLNKQPLAASYIFRDANAIPKALAR